MADYFCQFSFILPMSLTAAEAAVATHAAKLEADPHYPGGFVLAASHNGLLFRDDHGQPDLEAVIDFIIEVAAELKLTGLFGFEHAGTCSKPRLEGFCGGACVIDLEQGFVVDYENTNDWIKRTIAAHNAGRASLKL